MIDKVIMDRIIPQGSEVLRLAENENGRSGGGQIAATTSPKQVVSLFLDAIKWVGQSDFGFHIY